MIRLEKVCKRFGNVDAVRDFSLEVKRGELCCLIGPSGCGKSTTLKMINRMIEPTSGVITFDGRDARSLPPRELRRRMGYVIQSIGLFPHMSVLENIRVVPGLLGWESSRSMRRACELMELFGLDPHEFGNKYPRELSGGQAQRVGVARALAADPEVLLMDEPFGALDPITREHLQKQFATICAELDKAIVFVTHDLDEAVRLGTKVALMREGELVQCDDPETLLLRPKNAFVRRFVGSDRALKRLARLEVADFARPAASVAVTANTAELAAAFSRLGEDDGECARYLWVTDDAGRLRGWVEEKPGLARGVRRAMVEVEAETFAVEASASLKRALAGFFQQGVACLPVVDEDRILAGELRLGDLLES